MNELDFVDVQQPVLAAKPISPIPKLDKSIMHSSLSVIHENIICNLNCGCNGGSYLHKMPFSPDSNYFEIEIFTSYKPGNVACIGIIHEVSEAELMGQHFCPGTRIDTPFGLRLDTQRVYNWADSDVYLESPEPSGLSGDRFGVGFDYSASKIFFTKNGKKVYSWLFQELHYGPFLPFICLHTEGDYVRLLPNRTFDVEWEVDPRVVQKEVNDSVSLMAVDGIEEDWWLESVASNGLTFECTSVESPSAFGFAQFKQPLRPERHYFEMEVPQGTPNDQEDLEIIVGVCHKGFSPSEYPGFAQGSVAYHLWSGDMYEGNGPPESINVPKCKPGDVIGCGILFPTDYDPRSLEKALPDLEPRRRRGFKAPPREWEDAMSEESSDDSNPGGNRFVGPPVRVRRGNNQRLRRHRQFMAKRFPPYMYAQVNLREDNSAKAKELGPEAARFEESKCEVKVFFTRNHTLVATRKVKMPVSEFYPCIAFLKRHRVRINLTPLSG